MGEQELRLKANELDRLSIRCPHCKTAELIFPANSLEEVREIVCQNCNALLNGAKHLVIGYRKFFEEVQRMENVEFLARVKS